MRNVIFDSSQGDRFQDSHLVQYTRYDHWNRVCEIPDMVESLKAVRATRVTVPTRMFYNVISRFNDILWVAARKSGSDPWHNRHMRIAEGRWTQEDLCYRIYVALDSLGFQPSPYVWKAGKCGTKEDNPWAVMTKFYTYGAGNVAYWVTTANNNDINDRLIEADGWDVVIGDPPHNVEIPYGYLARTIGIGDENTDLSSVYVANSVSDPYFTDRYGEGFFYEGTVGGIGFPAVFGTPFYPQFFTRAAIYMDVVDGARDFTWNTKINEDRSTPLIVFELTPDDWDPSASTQTITFPDTNPFRRLAQTSNTSQFEIRWEFYTPVLDIWWTPTNPFNPHPSPSWNWRWYALEDWVLECEMTSLRDNDLEASLLDNYM